MRKIRISKRGPTLALILALFVSQNLWATKNKFWPRFENHWATLPGHSDLVFDDAHFLTEHVSVKPSLANQNYKSTHQSLRTLYRTACQNMLDSPSEANQIKLTKWARQYFGAKPSKGDPRDGFYIPPAQDPFQLHWLGGLSRYLYNLPFPTDLVLTPEYLDDYSRDTTLGMVELRSQPFQILLHISLKDQSWPPSVTLVHELFHLRQIQGHLAGSPDVWPRHVIEMSATNAYPRIVDRYLHQSNTFHIDEIGAYFRYFFFFMPEDELHLASFHEALGALANAIEFAAASSEAYRLALPSWTANPTKRASMYSQTESEVLIFVQPNLIIHLGLYPNQNLGAIEDWITKELYRGQSWVESYLTALRHAQELALL